MPNITGQTIGELTPLSSITNDTLFPVELSGITYHIPYSSVSSTYNYIGDSSSNTNIDWSLADLQELNLDNNPTLTFSNMVPGQKMRLLLKQTNVGTNNITWPSNLIWNNSNLPQIQEVISAPIDQTFEIGIGFNGSVTTIELQPDGKILVGGGFNSYSGVSSNGIIRLNSDGSIDNSFIYGIGFNGSVTTIELQPDGKILVGGEFNSYSGVSSNRIIRLNSDGSIDNSFIYGIGFNASVTTIELQPDGKILVGGGFSSYSGNVSSKIVRLESNGDFDSTFNVGNGFTGGPFTSIRGIDIQSDGKIIVVGGFTTYNSIPLLNDNIVRINTDGSLDSSFDVGTGFNSGTYDVKIQSDGKILVCGNFTIYSGFSSPRLIRLNSDATIDNTFSVGDGFDLEPRSIITQPDGKILLVGNFATYNNFNRNKIIRLNNDGSIDSSLTFGNGFDATTFSIGLQNDGKIIIGGNFTDYNGFNINRIGRLLTNPLPEPLYNKFDLEYNGTYVIGS